jgi:hypothetical protein
MKRKIFKTPHGLKKKAIYIAIAGKLHTLGFEDALEPIIKKFYEERKKSEEISHDYLISEFNENTPKY